MTEELLAWYRERLADNDSLELDHQQDLLAEVDRLRAREAAAMAIVRAVADGATTYRDHEDEYCTQDANCMWREESPGGGGPVRMIHTNRCIVTKARALLAEDSEASE